MENDLPYFEDMEDSKVPQIHKDYIDYRLKEYFEIKETMGRDKVCYTIWENRAHSEWVDYSCAQTINQLDRRFNNLIKALYEN